MIFVSSVGKKGPAFYLFVLAMTAMVFHICSLPRNRTRLLLNITPYWILVMDLFTP
jgi:hypothetical protein